LDSLRENVVRMNFGSFESHGSTDSDTAGEWASGVFRHLSFFFLYSILDLRQIASVTRIYSLGQSDFRWVFTDVRATLQYDSASNHLEVDFFRQFRIGKSTMSHT